MNNSKPDNTNIYGPSVILSGGTISTLFITTPDKYDRYSLYYTVGANNKSWAALQGIIQRLLDQNNKGVKPFHIPWKVNDTDGLVHIKANSRKQPPVLDADKARVKPTILSENMGVSVNLRPMFFSKTEEVSFRMPNGTMGSNKVTKKGISLYLNGVMMGAGEEDEF